MNSSQLLRLGLGVVASGCALSAVNVKDDPVGMDKGVVRSRLDQQGDAVPDFSRAGYMGGGVELPLVAARVRVAPSGGDDTARIQQALDLVASLKPDKAGWRGAVLLERGVFKISGSLWLRESGVVLRGSGEGEDGTRLLATGTDRRSLVRVRGLSGQVPNGEKRAILDARVPVGATILTLSDTAGLNAGDEVIISRPGTKEWIAAVGMHEAPGPTPYYWRPGMVDITFSRTVTAVSGKRIQLDAPITSALQAPLTPALLAVQQSTGQISRVGVERLSCVSETDPANPLDEEHAWTAIELDFVRDGWVRNVRARHFAGSAVHLGPGTRRVTVADCASLQPVSEFAGHRRRSFLVAGQQNLVVRCTAEDGREDFVAGHGAAGPIVFLDCSAVRSRGTSGSVGSWVTGLLFDNVSIEGGTLALDNAEIREQGQGWTAANSMLWQVSASRVICRRPPGATNWASGAWGELVGNGVWSKANEFVEPQSLYRAQLSKNGGAPALAALEPRKVWEPAGGEKAQPLDKLAKPVAARSGLAVSAGRPLSVRNGWLLAGESLLHGGQIEGAWWRGHINPGRPGPFGPCLTRFAPGVYGNGFTDDLGEVADQMEKSGTAAFRHHYGLWYDRRRDDHERTSRVDGDVWPPFFELPWARSGKGTTWNGLSRYDLTRFNPWYFRRLSDFAAIARERGLALVNEQYFQHNILEAGAHWVDFPWRPANSVQETGFPEPPVFAEGKRIFMAKEFYDTSHPVRRPLHELYIRKCLSNLAEHSNVIHTLGEEFTGPLNFARFWTETVAAWQAETGKDPLVCLSTNKDVQDALLADPATAKVYDIIEFKYWWQASGGLYAPESGKDLAPRQSERLWKGGKPTAATIAQMIWDYRSRFPGKAVMCVFGEAEGWATLSAGGSMPRLPRTVSPELLAALPSMKPVGPQPFAGASAWVLVEDGKQAFVYAPNGGSGDIVIPGFEGRCAVRDVDLKTGEVGTEITTLNSPSLIGRPSKPGAWWITRAN